MILHGEQILTRMSTSFAAVLSAGQYGVFLKRVAAKQGNTDPLAQRALREKFQHI